MLARDVCLGAARAKDLFGVKFLFDFAKRLEYSLVLPKLVVGWGQFYRLTLV